MAQADTFTRWGVVAAGEGGNRVAAELLAREDNPGIGERVLLLNTNRADIRNTIEQGDVDEDLDEYVRVFGDKRGVGNDFMAGERQTEGDIDEIADDVDDRMISADAQLFVTTLGGGTGNGSVPYLLREFDEQTAIDSVDYGPWIDDAVRIAVGIWPYYNEPAQRQFNARLGLSRLLRRDDGGQNADMTLLAGHSHIDQSDGRRDSYDRVKIAVNNPFAYEALYKAGFGFTGERTGIAELVLERPHDTDATAYRAGLARYRERDLSGAERSFLDGRSEPPDER